MKRVLAYLTMLAVTFLAPASNAQQPLSGTGSEHIHHHTALKVGGQAIAWVVQPPDVCRGRLIVKHKSHDGLVS